MFFLSDREDVRILKGVGKQQAPGGEGEILEEQTLTVLFERCFFFFSS